MSLRVLFTGFRNIKAVILVFGFILVSFLLLLVTLTDANSNSLYLNLIG